MNNKVIVKEINIKHNYDLHILLNEIFSDKNFSYKFKNFPLNIYIYEKRPLFSSKIDYVLIFEELYNEKVENIFETNLDKLMKVILEDNRGFFEFKSVFVRNLDLLNKIYKLGREYKDRYFGFFKYNKLNISILDNIDYNKKLKEIYSHNPLTQLKTTMGPQLYKYIEISGKNAIEEFLKIFSKIIYNEIKDYVEDVETTKIIKKINFNYDILVLINNIFNDSKFYDIFKTKSLKYSFEANNNSSSLVFEEDKNDDIENKFERNLKQFMKFILHSNRFSFRTIFEKNKEDRSKIYELGVEDQTYFEGYFTYFSDLSVIIYSDLYHYQINDLIYNSLKIEGKEKINKFLQILYNMLEKEINKFETDVPDFFD